MDEISPLKLSELENKPGSFRLTLAHPHMLQALEAFNDIGQECSGFNWEAVARQALRAYAPEDIGLMDFDPEADLFVAFGTHRQALVRLGELLSRALQEREFLEELLRDAEDDWFD